MKILIVSVSFYPEVSPRSFRTTELVKEFCRQGHEVVLAGLDADGRQELRKEYGFHWLSFGYGEWNRAFQWMVGKGGIWRMISGAMGWFLEFPHLEWYFKIPKKLRIEETFDLIISIAVPYTVHWGVNRAIKKGNIKGKVWVADCSDPFMLDVLRIRKVPFYFASFEKSFCRTANYLSVPLEGSKDGYYSEFREKIRVIPQGFDFEKEREKLPTYKKNDILTFVFAGQLLQKGRNPQHLLEFLSASAKDFRFYIFTYQKYLVTPFIKEGDERFVLCDIVPRENVMKFMRGCDFLINIMNSTPMQLPSKLIDYYIIDRPVFNMKTDELLAEDRVILNQFLESDYSGKFEFNGMEKYQISNVVEKFIELVK